MLRRMLAATAAVVLATAGCAPAGDDGAAEPGAVLVLAKAEGWRPGLQEAAGHPYALLEVAGDDAAALRAWEDNVPSSLPEGSGDPVEPGVYRHLDEVDLATHAVAVYSSGESSSCPAWVHDVAASDGRVEVDLRSTAGRDTPCTDDFRPYRLVIAVERDRLPAANDLPVERVDLPSEGLTDVEGRVVAYPAGGGSE